MATKKELLGQRIKFFRESRKLTQERLAEMVGIDSKHLSRIENGRNYPSLETLEKILENLDVTYEEVFNFKLLASKSEFIEKIEQKLPNLTVENLKTVYLIINELKN